VTRSRFLDRREDDDVLDLARRIDRLLKERSAGRDARLNFVDAHEAAEAYRIAGSYVVDGGIARVRFRMRRGQQAVGERVEVEGEASDPDEVARRVLAKAVELVR
jgi:hypothetical protein